MTITVTFEVPPQPTGRSTKKSPSNFPVDQATSTRYYTVNYDFDPDVNSDDNDNKISSVYIREFVKSLPTLSLASSSVPSLTSSLNSVPIENRFYNVFPLYIDWLKGNEPDIDSQNALTSSLQLADWLEDELYIDYVVQKIFDNWTNTMATVVYFEFYPELQHLVLIRTPWFLLPKYLTADKIFMDEWFSHNKDRIVWVDKHFKHYLNKPYELVSGSKVLMNFVTTSNNSRQPRILFYADSHRICTVEQSITKRGLPQIVGEITNYFDDDTGIIGRHGYIDDDQRKDGLWTTIEPDGKVFEELYEHGQQKGPLKIYYASGRVDHYAEGDIESNILDGIYPYYIDNVDSTLDDEFIYESGLLAGYRGYDEGKLTEEHYYVNDHTDHVDVYYDSGYVKTRIHATADNPEDIEDAVADELLTLYNVDVFNYYNNNYHNIESSGHLHHGQKVGVWRYYNDDAKNTLREVVSY